MNLSGVCLLLVLAGGGYAGYWGYQQYEQAQGELISFKGDLELTKAQLNDSNETVKLLRAAYVSDATVLDQNASSSLLPSGVTTLTGRAFSECKLSGVDPDGIRFMHRDGAGKITFTELDPSFAAIFKYDPLAGQKFRDEQTNRNTVSDTVADLERAREATQARLEEANMAEAQKQAALAAAAQQAQVTASGNDTLGGLGSHPADDGANVTHSSYGGGGTTVIYANGYGNGPHPRQDRPTLPPAPKKIPDNQTLPTSQP